MARRKKAPKRRMSAARVKAREERAKKRAEEQKQERMLILSTIVWQGRREGEEDPICSVGMARYADPSMIPPDCPGSHYLASGIGGFMSHYEKLQDALGVCLERYDVASFAAMEMEGMASVPILMPLDRLRAPELSWREAWDATGRFVSDDFALVIDEEAEAELYRAHQAALQPARWVDLVGGDEAHEDAVCLLATNHPGVAVRAEVSMMTLPFDRLTTRVSLQFVPRQVHRSGARAVIPGEDMYQKVAALLGYGESDLIRLEGDADNDAVGHLSFGVRGQHMSVEDGQV